MKKEDSDRFSRVEQQLLDLGEPLTVSQLSSLPFATYDELKALHSNREISFGSDYDGDFLQVIGTKSDNIIHAIWVSLPILLVIADIVLAIFFKRWILLLGIPFALLGFGSSSPYSPIKNVVSGLGGLAFVGSFFFLDWVWSCIIGTMLFSQIFTMTAREQYRMVVEERALYSEIFFCYMFKNSHIVVKDNKSNRIYKAN